MSDIRDLIDSISNNKSLEAEEHFNSILANKVSDRIESMKREVASSLFNSRNNSDGDN